jgi:hypothetical protein
MEVSEIKERISRNDLLEILSIERDKLKLFYNMATKKPIEEIGPIDHVIASILKRSNSLTEAFLTTEKHGNELAAMPYIRMQLDNVLRLSAFGIVDDPAALVIHLMEKGSLSKFKKYKLRDADLLEAIKARYPDIDSLYHRMSGYIHFSVPHLVKVLNNWDQGLFKEQGDLKYGEIEDMPNWGDDHRWMAISDYCEATAFLIQEVDFLEKKVQAKAKSSS